MSWEDVELYFDEGGAGDQVTDLVKKIRGDKNLRRRLKEDNILRSGATAEDSVFIVDRHILDDFLNGRLPMPMRAQVLSAVCQDKTLCKQLLQIQNMRKAEKEFEAGPEDAPAPDELKEEVARYDAGGGTVPLAAVAVEHGRWRIEELHPDYHYDIRPRAAARLGEEAAGLRLVDEATVSFGNVRCAIALSAHEKRLELQIENCPLDKERFEAAEAVLRSRAGPLLASVRRYSPRLARIIFEGLDTRERYRLEIDPALLSG